MMNYRVALIQMRVIGGDLASNLARAEERIEEAARGGASLVVLPEAMDLGWTDPSCREGAAPIPDGEAAHRLRAAAARHRLYVCAGLTERAEGRVYNAAVLIDPEGEVRCRASPRARQDTAELPSPSSTANLTARRLVDELTIFLRSPL